MYRKSKMKDEEFNVQNIGNLFQNSEFQTDVDLELKLLVRVVREMRGRRFLYHTSSKSSSMCKFMYILEIA